jgi:hypothetical protein
MLHSVAELTSAVGRPAFTGLIYRPAASVYRQPEMLARIRPGG